jgi:acyl-CoA thioester hydrolase
MQTFIWPIRIYYEDTDVGGVVYYANYLNFLERARTEMLRTHGFEQDQLMINEAIIFAVRAIKIDYLSPARFNDQIEISSKICQIKQVSLSFDQAITREDTLLCKAIVRIACLDVTTLRPKTIPPTLQAKFK